MTSEKIEHMIVRAIANLKDNSPNQRQKVYEAAVRSMFNAMASRPDGERQRRLDALRQSIIQIEMHYQSLTNDQVGAPERPDEPTNDFAVENQVRLTGHPCTPTKPNQGFRFLPGFLNPFGNWKLNLSVYGLVFLVFVLAGYAYFQFFNGVNNAKNEQQTTLADKPATQSSETSPQKDALTEEDGNLIFSAESDNFLQALKVQGKSDEFQEKTVNGEKQIWFSGKTRLISREFLKVQTDRIYHMAIEFRPEVRSLLKDIVIDAGFATYNGDKKIETKAPGRHRYFVANGAVGDNAVQTQDGWFIISGIITGVGAKPDAFRETSSFARPIFMMNIGNTKIPLEVRSLKVVELQ